MNTSKTNTWKNSLEERRKLTFQVKKEIFSKIPPFPREITLDINNRCNHKCYFCANPKIEHYDSLDKDLAFDLIKQGKDNGCKIWRSKQLESPLWIRDFMNLLRRVRG